VGFWNSTDSVPLFFFLLYFGTVLTGWVLFVFLWGFGTVLTVWVLFVFLCDFGTVPTIWHYLFLYWALEVCRNMSNVK
jgi:hypothetical protein